MEKGKRSRNKRELDRLKVKDFLDSILRKFNRKDYLHTDPIGLVHSYSDPEDQEIVALIAAMFSYGNVTSIRKAVRQILKPLNPDPSKKLRALRTRDLNTFWRGVYYRFYSEQDILFLISSLSTALQEEGRLRQMFRSCWDGDSRSSILQFQTKLKERGGASTFKSYGHRFMFSNPFQGTAKRWHLFLRWMVRKDDIDLGLWDFIPKNSLILPLDTHLFDISRQLGLTTKNSASLRVALEVTEQLKSFDPEDPLKYDFALCRLGILRLKHQLAGAFSGDGVNSKGGFRREIKGLERSHPPDKARGVALQ